MLNSSGTYGPNEAPNNMVASLNRSQSNSSHINHNLHSFGKIVHQAASTGSNPYETLNYPGFGQPSTNMPLQMNPFHAYQEMGHASPHMPQSAQFPHENSMQSYYPAVSTMTHAEHHNNMMNFHQNIMRTASELEITNEREQGIKNYPLNIPQVSSKIFQKSPYIDSLHNAQINHQSSTMSSEIVSQIPTGMFAKMSNNDYLSPENLSRNSEMPSKNIPDLFTRVTNSIESNYFDNPKNLSQNRMSYENEEAPKSIQTPILSDFEKHDHQTKPNEDMPATKMIDNCISERKRKSLEKTVRLIESILIKSTNNNMKADIAESNVDSDPLALSPKSDITKSNETDEVNESDSDDEALIKQSQNTKPDAKRHSPSKKIHSTRRSHVIENKTDVQFEIPLKLEPEEMDNDFSNVDVKVEHSSWPDIDYGNPFHRDSNGTPRSGVGDTKIISMETSVEEALESIENGTKSVVFYECPHCLLLLNHPKRFLVHFKWHTFGLLNEQRAEIAREREDKAKAKRRARIIQRLTIAEATGVEQEQFPCKNCEKVFQTRSSLKNHRRRFHPTEQTECRICLLPVYGLKALREHMTTHEDKEAGVHQCPHCPKRFKYRHSLAKHADTHLEKTHGCPECSKMFGSAQLVRLHMKTHERAARGTTYHCSYCGKGFYEPYNLNVHERTHRNDKPFKCDICESCFVTNSSLKRHVKVSHSGAKPHSCKVCQKCFSTASIRDRHELRVHTDQKLFPHQCQLCPRRYMKPKDLRNHMYKMHAKERKKDTTIEAEPLSS